MARGRSSFHSAALVVGGLTHGERLDRVACRCVPSSGDNARGSPWSSSAHEAPHEVSPPDLRGLVSPSPAQPATPSPRAWAGTQFSSRSTPALTFYPDSQVPAAWKDLSPHLAPVRARAHLVIPQVPRRSLRQDVLGISSHRGLGSTVVIPTSLDRMCKNRFRTRPGHGYSESGDVDTAHPVTMVPSQKRSITR